MDINFQHSKKLCLATTSLAAKSSSSIRLNPRLSCIIEETFKVRSNAKKIKEMSGDPLKVTDFAF